VHDDAPILLGGAYVDLPTGTRLRASAARKVRFPSIVQLYSIDGGNRNLDTEVCWCFEAGIEQALPLGSRLELVGFWQELDDFIERGTTRLFENRQDLRIRGVELAAETRPFEPVLLRASYSYLETEDRSRDALLPRLANRPRHTVDGEARYEHPWHGDLRVGVRHIAGIEQDSRNAPFVLMDLDDFTTVDVRIAQRLFEDHFEVYAGVDDVFDEQGEINFGFPMPGRTVVVGGSVRF
jgi:outer membrane cobalamin receptor